jgi:hypothetical protein
MDRHHHHQERPAVSLTTVLDVTGMRRASEQGTVQRLIGRLPGVLMRSDPLDVPTALTIGRGTLRKMRQNLGWAIGYNAIALPIAAGVFEPAFDLGLRPRSPPSPCRVRASSSP